MEGTMAALSQTDISYEACCSFLAHSEKQTAYSECSELGRSVLRFETVLSNRCSTLPTPGEAHSLSGLIELSSLFLGEVEYSYSL